ncbi:MAG: hypothetical protein WKG32_04245 [Gemmatimonadaceae bacterium]
MRNRVLTWSGLMTSVVVVAAGCSDSPAPTAPRERATQRASLGLDAEFLRMAKETPGFGGMYYDNSGRLHIFMKKSQRGATTPSALAGKLRARGLSLSLANNAAVEDGDYDFAELAEWHDRLSPAVLAMPGVAYTDISERQNRIRIGITRQASPASVDAEIAAEGIPRQAVLVDFVEPVRQVVTLRERVRPVAGGLQILFPLSPTVGGICTLGFNARRPTAPTNFFLTASHCSLVQGALDSTFYFQPSRSVPETWIGVEAVDPPFGSAGGLCPVGRRCRFSDALMARYAEGVNVAFGALYRTTFTLTRIGSIEIDSTNPRFQVVGDVPFPFLGEVISKVGRTTGWTTGEVLLTCVNTNVSGSNVTLLCQDFVGAGVGAGDSGSPVFQQLGTSNNAVLYGILWGSSSLLFPDGSSIQAFIFSAMENIRLEVGPIRTF